MGSEARLASSCLTSFFLLDFFNCRKQEGKPVFRNMISHSVPGKNRKRHVKCLDAEKTLINNREPNPLHQALFHIKGANMKNCLSESFFVFLFSFLLIQSAWAAEPLFNEIRTKTAKTVKLSLEDYRLGKELMVEIRKLAAKKRPAVPTPIISFETLSAAGRMWYTDYNYTDRQLFCSRDLWTGGPSQYQQKAYRKTYEIFELYGVSAFNAYVYYESFLRYQDALGSANPDLKLIPTVTPPGYNGPLKQEMMKTISGNPRILRINGQVLYLCWGWVDIPKTKEFIRKLEKMTGEPAGLIYSCGTVSGCAEPYLSYAAGKGVPASSLLHWFDFLTEVLQHCAGIEYANYLDDPEGNLHASYYNEIIVPLFAAVCAQEQYNGKKLCGLEILTGYNNYRGRQRLSANGTKTLRAYLEISKRFNLDILKAFEWDEYNEDSHFQPTVNKPMAYQRILKYWNDTNHKRRLTPNPGDDLSLPNLILSHRKQISCGPDYELEILHIPDSGTSEPCMVTAEIVNEKGQVLLKEDLQFNRAEFKEYTLHIPGKDYIDSEVLVTRLSIDYQGNKKVIQEGLPFTVVRPTIACDSTWYSTPLRNVLFPAKAELRFGKVIHPKGALAERIEVPVSAKLSFPDPLNSLEVLQNGRDIRYSYDPQNEFHQNDPGRINLILTFYHLEMIPFGRFNATMAMKNAPSATWFAAPQDPSYSYLKNCSVKQNEYSFAEHPHIKNAGASSWRNARMISLKKTEFDKAVFEISGTYLSGPEKGGTFAWTLPLAKLKAAGVCNKIFENGFQIALEIPQHLDRLPLPVMNSSAEFEAELHTGYPDGVLAARAVSRTGKVWWSAPHVLKRSGSGEKATVSVYHNQKGAYDLPVAANRVPHIQYRFNPAYAGNILTTAAGREFYGNLGGYDLVPTGYEGYHCSVYDIPYSFRQAPRAGEKRLVVPEYEKSADGTYCLNFSGKGEFIGFPPSLFPQRSGYTVRFEVLPLDVDRDQVYFVHAEHDIAGFRLRTEDQRLVVDFYRRQASNAPEDSTVFKTSLDPVEGKWNKIEFKYDMRKISVTLNGQTESFPTEGIPRWVAVGGFGGDGTKSRNNCVQYFKGKLKSFEVIHSAR